MDLPVRPAAALLSKRALEKNLRIVERQIRSQARLHRRDAQIMAIVKADAYGHDMDCIVPELEKLKIRHFAVASLAEGVEARGLTKKSSILVLGGTFDWRTPSLEALVENNLKVAANDIDSLKKFLLFRNLPIHLKLDTGMNRLGLKPEDWSEAARLIKNSRIKLDGLFTHFATVSDRAFHEQARLFEEAVRWFWNQGIRPMHVHSENSSSLFGKNHVRRGILSEVTNLTRPGLSLYGYLPAGMKNSFGLTPVLELVSELGEIKDLQVGEGVSYGHLYKARKPHSIAIVPLGYADGLSKNYGAFIAPEWRSPKGTRKGSLKVCGAICMDMVMVRAERGALKAKDRIAFWGRFPNPLLSKHIVEPYELNLRINKRIPRLWGDDWR